MTEDASTQPCEACGRPNDTQDLTLTDFAGKPRMICRECLLRRHLDAAARKPRP